ncbi:MAG TPA: peptide deformylase [Ilumatobacteraceae bacterium]
MIREILTIGDPFLRQPTRRITVDELRSPAMQQVIDDMIDTMRHANGAGIAANQIGEPYRITVIEVEDNPRYPYKPRVPLTVVVNPIIEQLGDERFDVYEGCLSVPDLRGEVSRSVSIRARYLDRDAGAHDVVIHGLTAGTYQHECDHLDGKLFVDRVTDTTTLCTWAQFQRFHRAAFVDRIMAFIDRVAAEHPEPS